MNAMNAYLRLFEPAPEDPSPRALKRMIESELKKEEPDADLIEYCLDALNERKPSRAVGFALLPRAARVALIAALLAVLLFGAVAAAGTAFGFDPLQKIVAFYDDRIRIFTGPAADSVPAALLEDASLSAALAAHGFADVYLPAALFAAPFSLSEPVFEETDLLCAANLGVTGETIRGSLVITRYNEKAALPAVDYPAAENAVHVASNGIDVYLFDSGDGCVCTYVVGRTVYTLVLSCAAADAVSIAGTVR